MLRIYGKYWWSFLVRGIMATLFGVVAIVLPGVTMEILAVLLAAFLIVDGLFSFIASFQVRRMQISWGPLLFEGVAGMALGLFTFIWPGLTVLAIVLVIGLWAMLTGVLEIIAGVKLRNEIQGEWLLVSSGVLSLLFSVILLTSPGVGAVAIAWMIGVYALVFGVSLIFLGIRLRKHNIIINI